MTAAVQSPPLIALDDVCKRYGAAPVLVDVSLDVGRGEFVLVTAPGGAGKTTLLRLIGGLEEPDSGQLRVGGSAPARLRGRQRALLRRSIGMIPQRPILLQDRSVLANVMLPVLAAGATYRDATRRARTALERVGIHAVEQKPSVLSASAQRQMAVARAIANRPALILADEPLADLDRTQADSTLALLEEFAASGVTVVMASQRSGAPPGARTLTLGEGRLA